MSEIVIGRNQDSPRRLGGTRSGTEEHIVVSDGEPPAETTQFFSVPLPETPILRGESRV